MRPLSAACAGPVPENDLTGSEMLWVFAELQFCAYSCDAVQAVPEAGVARPASSSGRQQAAAAARCDAERKRSKNQAENAGSQPAAARAGVQRHAPSGVLQSSQENVDRSQAPSSSGYAAKITALDTVAGGSNVPISCGVIAAPCQLLPMKQLHLCRFQHWRHNCLQVVIWH